MPNYTVTVCETLEHTVVLDADNKFDAREKAFQIVMNDPDGYSTESLGTQEADISVEEN
jgi:hypothetical protein